MFWLLWQRHSSVDCSWYSGLCCCPCSQCNCKVSWTQVFLKLKLITRRKGRITIKNHCIIFIRAIINIIKLNFNVKVPAMLVLSLSWHVNKPNTSVIHWQFIHNLIRHHTIIFKCCQDIFISHFQPKTNYYSWKTKLQTGARSLPSSQKRRCDLLMIVLTRCRTSQRFCDVKLWTRLAKLTWQSRFFSKLVVLVASFIIKTVTTACIQVQKLQPR